MCAVLGKPLMSAYPHGKDSGRLRMLTLMATTSGVTLCRWHIVSPWSCSRAEHPSSSSSSSSLLYANHPVLIMIFIISSHSNNHFGRRLISALTFIEVNDD